MSKKLRIAFISLLVLGVILLGVLYVHSHNIAVFNPEGEIAFKERRLMLITLLLSIIVVVPVFLMTFIIVWRYRATNTKAKTKYSPDWDHSRIIESFWWGIPCAIIGVLA